MTKVLFLMAFVCALASAFNAPYRDVLKVKEGILQGRMGEIALKAISKSIEVGANELRKKGHFIEASVLESGWNDEYQYEFKAYVSGYDIGDHAPLWLWLSDRYNSLEIILGKDVCAMLHLTSLKIFNFTPQVVFRPCSFSMDSVIGDRIDEYRRHFSLGSEYYGFVPEITYWFTYIGCTAGTVGSGFSIVCGMAGSVSERLMVTFVSPKLSDAVYHKSCGGY